MRFIVSATSSVDIEQMLPNMSQKVIRYVEYARTKELEEGWSTARDSHGNPCADVFRESWEEEVWYALGTNHRVEGGMLVKDLPDDTEWVLETDKVDDLMALVDATGKRIILGRFYEIIPHPDEKIDGQVFIYDSYIE